MGSKGSSRLGAETEAIGHEHDLYLAAVCIINDPKFVALFGYLSYLHYYYIRRAVLLFINPGI